jgi:hypothetical protein
MKLADATAYQAETDRLAAWHVEQLGFGPGDTARHHQATTQAQLERWGATGLGVIAVDEDAEAARVDAEWEATTAVDVLDLIDQLVE